MLERFSRLAVTLLFGAVALGSATAQEATSFNGLTFDPGPGWCAQLAEKGNQPALAITRCDTRYPYVTIQVLEKEGFNPAKLPYIYGVAADMVAGPAGLSLFTGILGPECGNGQHRVEKDVVPGVMGYAVVGNFTCTKQGAAFPFEVRNFIAYVAGPNGSVWMIEALDLAPTLSADEQRLVRSLAAKIEGR